MPIPHIVFSTREGLGYSLVLGLAGLGSLEELLISTGDALSDADFACLESLGRLRSLVISCPTVAHRGLASIGKLKQLESVDISSNAGSGLNQLNGLSNLQRLRVGPAWGDARKRYAADEVTLDLSGLKHLKDLSLGSQPLQDSDLAFLEHLPLLQHLFIDMETNSLTGASLRHLKNLGELNYLYVSGLSGCTGKDLAHLTDLPKLRSLHLTGDIPNTALASLTGPASIESINIYTDQPIQKQTVAELTKSHPVIEYIRIEGVPKASTRPVAAPRRTGVAQPRR